MKKRTIGNSGIAVSPLAFGGNVFGWTADERTSFALLDAFVDAGFNFIDTADVYSHWAPGNKGGESETIIGRWLGRGGRREKVVIATKVGSIPGTDRKDLSGKYILQAVENSLRRLRTDYIDLYQSHYDDPNTPPEETLDAYDRLVKAGKVRAIGASNYSAKRLSRALDVSDRQGYPRYECLQTLYNLYDREEFENDLAPLCRKQGLSVISYFSLASGFLTGKYRSEKDLEGRSRAGMVKKYLDDRGMRILRVLDQVAREQNSSPVRIALAWIQAQPGITAPIASATSLDQLQELIEATAFTLDDASIKLLNEAGAADRVIGA